MASSHRDTYRDPDEQNAAATSNGLMRCLHRDVAQAPAALSRTSSDWREVPANREMAALLMPKRMFKAAKYATMSERGFTLVAEGTAEAQNLAAALACAF